MHLIDSTQNDQFHDVYFSGIDFDLSKALFIFSYNDENFINPILQDRITKIKLNGFDINDKINIMGGGELGILFVRLKSSDNQTVDSGLTKNEFAATLTGGADWKTSNRINFGPRLYVTMGKIQEYQLSALATFRF